MIEAFVWGTLFGVFMTLVVAAPFVWCDGYRSGNRDGLLGWRSEGLVVRRVR